MTYAQDIIARRALLAIGLLALTFASPLAAQDLDDLFGTPDAIESDRTGDGDATSTDGGATGGGTDATSEECECVEVEDEDLGPPIDVAALTTSPTSVSGSASASAGIGIGLTEWPWAEAAAGRSLRDLIEYQPLAAMSASVSVNSQPTPYLRFSTSLSTSLSESSLSFGTPAIGSLFIEYTVRDTVLLRAGRFGLGWGYGRLFGSVGNLVSDVGSGAALRGVMPVGRGTIELVTWAAGSATLLSDLNFAGQWEDTFGPFNVQVRARGRRATGEPITTAVGTTWALGELTMQAEVGRVWNLADPLGPSQGLASAPISGALVNAFWESGDRAWSVLAEYNWAPQAGAGEHRVGVALRTPTWSGRAGFRPAVVWNHAINDGSGAVVAGINGTLAPSMTISLGVPLVYGATGSYYRTSLAAGSEVSQFGDVARLGNVVMGLAVVSLSMSF